MNDFQEYLIYHNLFNGLKSINRQSVIQKGSTRSESVAEHTLQLVSIIEYFFLKDSTLNQKLDYRQCIQLALCHDLEELFIGDSYDLSPNYQEAATSLGNFLQEAKLQSNIIKTLSLASESYKNKRDPNALFVWALDKLLPRIQYYITNGDSSDGKPTNNYKRDLQNIEISKVHSILKEIIEILYPTTFQKN